MSYLKEMAEAGYNSTAIGPFHRRMLPYMVQKLGVRRDELIVDVGAAQGHCSISLKHSGYDNIAVVDIDPYNFALFREDYKFQCHQCDVSKEAFPIDDNTAGLILNFHLIEHLENPGHFLDEAFRILRKGGVIALVTPDWRKQYKIFYRDPTHVHPYDKESIGRLFRIHGFSDIRIYSWGSAFGLGRMQAYRLFPRLGMIGSDLLALGCK